jgi:formate dehydrogenase beta subunit
MALTRRTALQALLAAGSSLAGAAPAEAAVTFPAPPDAVGLLYDATRCIGCKACMAACKEANGLPADYGDRSDRLYDAPVDLSPRSKTVIKLAVDGERRSFFKAQCMHCLDPACASACMLGALQKRELGIVTYDADLCVGCRYCEVGCPFGVPKFEYMKAAPRIVKCELCHDRIARGLEPACTDVCPREAVIYGKRTDLLEEAKRRLKAHPDRYVPRIYGEVEGGGTQVLYLSHLPFEKLGLPALGEWSAPALVRSIQHGVYRGFIAPAALYATLGFVMLRNRKRHADDREEPQS